MQNHLPVNAASEMLERTRRTVKRALRNTSPDRFERGQPRWRLPVIIDALASRGAPMTQPRHVQNGSDLDAKCVVLFAQFDAAFEKLKALPTLPSRRAAAVGLYAAIEKAVIAMKARDAADGLHEDHVSLRSDRVFYLLMIGFEGPCAWSKDQVWENLIPDEGDD
jgi:hypothetical protein